MVVFARNALNVATDPLGVSQRTNFQHQGAEPITSNETDDLHRLQTVVEWLNRERMVVALEAAVRKKSLRPRRAASRGISPVIDDFEHRTGGAMPFVLAPPLVCDRLPQPLPRPHISDTTLFVLTTITIMGLIGYYVSESSSSVLEMAQAALVHAP
jgi:hypothetical protein